MRKDDHQFFQPMYIVSLGELGPKEPFDEEKTGWGWRTIAKLDTKATRFCRPAAKWTVRADAKRPLGRRESAARRAEPRGRVQWRN